MALHDESRWGEMASRPLDASLSRPVLDSTLICDRRGEAHEGVSPPHGCPLLALVSVNSASAPSAEVPWSQLLALSLVEETDPPVLTVGRHRDCNIQLADPRVSLRHFEVSARRARGKDVAVLGSGASSTTDWAYECVLHDSSSNGTTVNGRVVGKGNTERLRTGDEICVLPANRVGREKMIAFVFRNTAELLSATPELMPVEEEPSVPPTPQRAEAQALELEDLVVCPICMQVIYKCVAVIPCFHNFCTTCCSDWMQRKDDCPVCRMPISALMKNHPMEAVIEAYLEAHTDRRRSPEELQDMDDRDELQLGIGGKVVRDICLQGPSPAAPHAPPEPTGELQRRPSSAGQGRAAGARGRSNSHARGSPRDANRGRDAWPEDDIDRVSTFSERMAARRARAGRADRPPARAGSQVCTLQ